MMISLLLMLHGAMAGAAGAEIAFPEVDALPLLRELPDPFRFLDGRRVTSETDWAERRKEIRAMLLHYEYGHAPEESGAVTVEDMVSHPALDGAATAWEFTVVAGGAFRMHAGLLTPATGGPRFPVIIAIDPVWQEHVVPVARRVVARGYAFAGLLYHDVDDDNADRSNGVYPHYPSADWCTLAAWAWAGSRLTDYLCTREDIDAGRMTVTGHSRTGKAALLMGALDERIGLVAPHASGAGGSGSFRINGKDAETLALITDPQRFHYWFHPRLATFAGKEDRLPFDQHFLKALVAPRALLCLEASGDLWANPLGTQQTNAAAQPVFDFLGVPKRLGLFVRGGGHDPVMEDWDALLDYADFVFHGKPVDDRFYQRPYPNAPAAFSWGKPGKP